MRTMSHYLSAAAIAVCTCLALPASGVQFVSQEDHGALRAVTDHYTAEIRDGEFIYTPSTFSTPALRYSLRSVRFGDQTIAVEDRPRIKCARNVLCAYYDGIISESYTAGDNGVEQCWVISRKPCPGSDITIEGKVTSPLRAVSSPGGVSFVDDSGRGVLHYSDAIVIDSDGRRCSCPSAIAEGRLLIRIPAEYVESARFPLLVDPVVGPEIPNCAAFGPAPGNQKAAEIARGRDNYLAVWQDSRGGGQLDIFATRLDNAGQMIDSFGIAVCAANSDQTNPDVAWNGVEYLVVWSDRRSGNAHIYGARVRPTGEVIDRGGLLISGTTGAQVYPRVESDGAGWLVVWQDSRGSSYDIYGCKVNGDGSMSPCYGISTRGDNEETPDVAWNGSNYLVVWRDFRNSVTTDTDIYGCRVAANGIRMGSDIVVSNGASSTTGANGKQCSPRVCATDGSCMVVWEDYRSNPEVSDVYGARVSSGGTVSNLGGVLISAAPEAQELPSIGSNGARYLCVWRDRSDRRVRGARLDFGGTVIDPSGITISAQMAGSEGVAVSGGSTLFVVGWNTIDVTDADILSTVVSHGGGVYNPQGGCLSRGIDDQSEYAVIDDGSGYAMVWAQPTDYGYDVMVSRMSYSGVLLNHTPVNVTPQVGGDQFEPAIAWNGSKYLIVWSGNEGADPTDRNISGCFMNQSLFPLSSRFTICAATNDQRDPCVASNGSNFLVAWEDYRSAASPYYYSDLYAATVSSTGTIKAASPVVCNASGDQKMPHAASYGSDYYVAWEDYRMGYPQVYGTRVSTYAQPLEAGGIAMPATSYNQTRPHVCAGSGCYFVTWSDRYSITACRVSTAGALQDPSGIIIATGNKIKAAPWTSWDGERYRVVWEDYRSLYSGNSDVYYTCVSSGGVVSADPATLLVADMISQLSPAIFAYDDAGMLFYSRYDNYANHVRAVTLQDENLVAVQSIGAARSLAPGSLISVSGKQVTAVFSDCFYVEENDRSGAIKVVSAAPATRGRLVDVIGTVSIMDGEPQLNASSVYDVGAAPHPIEPFFVRGDGLGGGPINGYVTGITGGSGANNIGLLMKTWGVVKDSGSGYFNIQPRPGVTVRVNSGSLSKPAVNSKVTVVGISTCNVRSGAVERAIRPRDAADIEIH